jgi:hypothetical protein
MRRSGDTERTRTGGRPRVRFAAAQLVPYFDPAGPSAAAGGARRGGLWCCGRADRQRERAGRAGAGRIGFSVSASHGPVKRSSLRAGQFEAHGAHSHQTGNMKAVQEEIFGPVARRRSGRRTTSCPRPTTPTTAWAPGCSAATSARPSAPSSDSGRAPCGQHVERVRCGAAVRRLQGVGLGVRRWAPRSSATTWRPRPSSPI